MSLLVEEYLSAYLCGYRKGFSTKQALLSLLERWKNVLDKKGYGGAVLMGLSKTFDTFLNHELLIINKKGYTNADLKISLYVRVHIRDRKLSM